MGRRVINNMRAYKRIDMKELARLHSLGKNDSEMGILLGYPRDSITRARHRLNLPRNPYPPDHRKGIGGQYTYDHEVIKQMLRDEVPSAIIQSKIGCSETVVSNCRKEMGTRQPHPEKALAPFAERLALARRMVDEHCSFADITRTTHVNRKVLHREFPGAAWTAREAGQHAMLMRWGEKKIREAWAEKGAKQRLTKPPLTN